MEAVRFVVDTGGAVLALLLALAIGVRSARLPLSFEGVYFRWFSGFLIVFAVSRFVGHTVVPLAGLAWPGVEAVLPYTGAFNSIVFAGLAAATLFHGQAARGRQVLEAERERLRQELEASQQELRRHRDRLMEAVTTARAILEGVVERQDYGQRFPNPHAVRCWELYGCEDEECPAHGVTTDRCWRVRGGVRGLNPCHVPSCAQCEVRRLTTPDEIAALAETMNDLLHLLEHHAREERLYLSALSHDIRGPLGAVKGFLDLLEAGEASLTPQQAELVSLARFSVVRVMHLAENLVLEGRVQENGLVPTLRPVSVEDLVGRLAREFAHAARIRGCRIETVLDSAPQVIRADPVLLERALANLLENALRHAPRDTPVTVRARAGDRGLRIAVEDRGPGVPEPLRREIFRPYRRFSDRGTAGLGLYVVGAVCEAHGGRAWVEPGPGGRGSRFVMELPAQREGGDAHG